MSSSSNNDALAALVSMGFGTDQAKEALIVSNGNLEAAANYLLTGGNDDSFDGPNGGGGGDYSGAASSSVAAGSSFETMVTGSISQYSVEGGRSACTCIALKAAENFLKLQKQRGDGNNSNTVVNADFLRDMILQGCRRYKDLPVNRTNGAEHLSAEDALATNAFPDLQQIGCIRQGLLTRDPYHELGMKQLLADIQSDKDWTAVLLTKTPETVLVCLPPQSNSIATLNNFVLIDSHPRPSQFSGADAAYSLSFTTLSDLVTALQSIFPVTDLGPDVPELMSTMYNSFDVYSLKLKA